MTLVSYVIPCFNGELFIDQCLDSVFSQQGVSIEAVVVDDGSSDQSVERVKSYIDSHLDRKVSLFTHKKNRNRGVSAARKLGVLQASGEFICFLDVDDYLLEPRKTLDQVSAFRSDPGLVMVHTAITAVGDGYNHSSINARFGSRSSLGSYLLSDLDDFLVYNRICNSTTMVPALLLKHLPFDSPQCYQYEDWVLWLLLSRKGRFKCLSCQAVAYRLHSESATSFLLRNQLRHYYSLLELKLILLARSGLSLLSLRVMLSLRSDIRILIRTYTLDGVNGALLPMSSRVCLAALEGILFPFSSITDVAGRMLRRVRLSR